MDIKAILFDFDGVIAKTPEDHANAWVKAMADFGLVVKPKDWFTREGAKVTQTAQVLWEKGGGAVGECNPDEVVARKEYHYKRNHNFEFYEDIEDLISLLAKKKVPIGIVTSSIKSNIEETVPAEFLKKFNVLVYGDMVSKGKPNPEPYLEGARALGLEPSECVVVENAPLGIESAKTAGAYAVAVETTASAKALKKADVVIQRVGALTEVEAIKSLIKKYEKG